MENKQTAVEWLVKKIELTDFWKEEIQQALEMEKEQHEETFEEYYSETYKK